MPRFLNLIVFLCGSLLFTSTLPAAGPDPTSGLDKRSQQAYSSVKLTVQVAGKEFVAGRFEKSARSLEKAMHQINVALDAGSPALYEALMPKMQRIVNARVLIELEGVTIAPFDIPPHPSTQPPPTAMAEDAPQSQPKPSQPKPSQPKASETKPSEKPGPSSTENNEISFVSQVAPILVSKCGNCHIRRSKGGFSLTSFAHLMKGPPEGVVVFPGDTIGSRLIETIKTGDMPRGGGSVSAKELATLERWINEGAKYDGPNPAAQLTSLKTTGGAAPAANMPTPVAGTPSGKETVDFASEVAPLLVANCTGCHIDARRAQGGLQMDNLARLFRGGDSGAVVQPGQGEASLLVRKLRGTEGNRMPAGGRPPLKDSEIQLISKWIDEGAAVQPSLKEESLKAITQIAWLADATDAEVSARRSEIAKEHFALAEGSAEKIAKHQTDHFVVWGDVAPQTLKTVAGQAEAALQKTSMVLPAQELSAQGDAAEAFFHGRASIYVLPRRYDYSEFAQMVERRSLPSDWDSHWFYDGVQAYVALVASENDDEAESLARLAAPVASLAVRSRASSVPRWFADGLGKVIAASETKLDRNERKKLRTELVTAVSTLKSGKDFLNGKLAPERSDLIAAAVCESFLTREKKRGFDTVMRGLAEGKRFDEAFLAGMGVTPVAYLDAWVKWVK